MSFLNPVSEPVLRFSSTDADAPQINYAARTAGDVKAVLKACLVTGYGDKASAGWSIANEVDHVAEFVSPSAAMSDYKLGIDDSLTTSTTWSYFFNGTKTGDTAVNKAFRNAVKTSASNKWELLASDRGFYFVETIFNDILAATGSRVSYFGQNKISVTPTNNRNIALWFLGYDAPTPRPSYFFLTNSQAGRTYDIEGLSEISPMTMSLPTITSVSGTVKIAYTDILSPWYLYSNNNIIGQQVGALIQPKLGDDTLTESQVLIDGRDMMKIYPIRADTNLATSINQSSNLFLYIALDYWEY